MCGSINGNIALITIMSKRLLTVHELWLISLMHLFANTSMYRIVQCFGIKYTDRHVQNFLKIMLQETAVRKHSLPLEIRFLNQNLIVLIVLTFHGLLSHSLKPASWRFCHVQTGALSLQKPQCQGYE